MHNALILGSGRSGTSMIAGSLAGAGYFQGDALHAARASNPKGFFEAPEVNNINEALLAGALEPDAGLGEGQRWLGVPRLGARFDATPELAARMASLVARAPFCFKDPRFSFTLPAWRAALPEGTRFVAAFRHPSLTATSLVREAQNAAYLKGVRFDLDRAFDLWIASYRSILTQLEADAPGAWCCVHYDQVLTAEGRERLGAFLDASLDDSFADPRMRRSVPPEEAPEEARELYAELCERAGHSTRTLSVVTGPQEDGPDAAPTPRVRVVAWIGPDDATHAADLRADVAGQRGVEAELVLIDGTDGGSPLAGSDVAPGSWSRCADLRCHGLAGDAPYVAFAVPGARLLPAHLAHAVDRLEAEGAELATCDYLLSDDQGRFVDRSSPAAMGDVPGPLFEAGFVARRAALDALDEAAFFPGELRLWRELRRAGRATHTTEPGFVVDRRRYVEGWDRAQHDAALVKQALRSRTEEPVAPALSVSLCTFNRRAVLRDCLESFARQLARPGAFEVLLTDDGSTDGTHERLEGLALPVPLVHVRRENGGLSAARNSGLAHARGRLVLFVNDDTIAHPELVERHLARHDALAVEGRTACVLGTFEQDAGALDNALLRHLESSNEVFGYADLEPGGTYDAFKFWTCNASAPLAAIRRAGGFDESFRHYGCEDTDLGFRMGLEVVYDPSARANHRHVMDFEYIRRRAQTVARAYVRFFRKHPDRLAAWGQEELSAAQCRQDLAYGAATRPDFEAALGELARMNVGALTELEGEYAAVAREVLDRIAEILPEVNPLWWREGTLAGFAEHGIDGFPDLTAAGPEPWPIATTTGRVLLAAPNFDDAAALDALLQRVAPVASDGFATLLLVLGEDSDRDAAMASLSAAWQRAFGDGGDLEVLLEESRLERAELLRLGRSVDAFLPLGSESDAFLDAVGAERLESAEDVQAWRLRFEGLAASSAGADAEPAPRATTAARDAAPERSVPELSVIVPTHNRVRELAQLLEGLRAQDLAPERFEVIVVDDGSADPVEPRLAAAAYPFALRVLTQAPSGPGAARNRGVAAARAETIVFFNDDAVPAADCLRRHLAAHALSDEPRAVLGTFGLLGRHVRDSFTLAAERTNILFAQPMMKPGVCYHGLSLCTGNVSLRKRDLDAVGGFDEALLYAGGEDSECGARLERELNLRVVFDPRVRAGHDHALDVEGFAARRRVVGWSAHGIQSRHPQAGLFQVESWDAFAQEVEAEAPDRMALLAEIAAVCAREHAGMERIGSDRWVLKKIERLSALEFRHGLLLGHRGILPAPAPGEASGEASGEAPTTEPTEASEPPPAAAYPVSFLAEPESAPLPGLGRAAPTLAFLPAAGPGATAVTAYPA